MNKIFFSFLFALLVMSLPVHAAVVGQTDESTRVGGGARPLGMGGAYVAVADDADAMFINPSGLASLKGPQAMAMFTSVVNEVYYSEFCGAMPSDYGTVGIGYIATGVNNIPTVIASSEVPTDYYDGMLLLTYSSPLARFFEYSRNVYVGANLKIFSRGWSGGINEFASGWSGDFGIKYVASPYLSFGLVRQNFVPVSLGSKIVWDNGVEESVSGSTNLGVAVRSNLLKESLLFTMDYNFPSFSGQPETLHLGTEWKMNEYVSLRGGFAQRFDASSSTGTTWSPAMGVSFGYGGLRVDYSYLTYYNDPALATYYVSLSYIGEPWLALKGETAPLIENPTRE